MAIEIHNLTYKKAFELLNDNFVINRFFSLRYNNKTQNIFQIKKEEDKYYISHFNSFGIKTKTEEINLETIKLYINAPTRAYKNNRYFETDSWSYHKKKIAKKTLDSSIIDEAESKKNVYKWLLKTYKNSIIIPEFSIYNRRADYVCFHNNETIIIEIKSEVDNFTRLEEQLKAYQTFGNYIFVAVHSNKIDKLHKYNIPDNVGIIEINKNLNLIKEAKKIENDVFTYRSYLSYNEERNLIKGLKFNTKIENKDIFPFLRTLYTDKELLDFFHFIIKSRYIEENEIRQKLFKDKKINEAISSSNKIGINRFDTGNSFISVLDYLNASKDALFNYFKKFENNFLSIFKDYPFYLNIKNDNNQLRYFLDKYNINLFCDDLEFFHKMIENKDLLISEYKNYVKFLEDNLVNLLTQIDLNNKNFLEIETKEELIRVSNFLNSHNIKFTLFENKSKDWKFRNTVQAINDNGVYIIFSKDRIFWGKTTHNFLEIYGKKN